MINGYVYSLTSPGTGGWRTFSVKGHLVNILGFTGLSVSRNHSALFTSVTQSLNPPSSLKQPW